MSGDRQVREAKIRRLIAELERYDRADEAWRPQVVVTVDGAAADAQAALAADGVAGLVLVWERGGHVGGGTGTGR